MYTATESGSEEPFRLGVLRIRPAEGAIEGPGGIEQVDPKVMAVLVLLSSRNGQVVSRDELIESVWGGRLVTEDAISRCIYQLRWS